MDMTPLMEPKTKFLSIVPPLRCVCGAPATVFYYDHDDPARQFCFACDVTEQESFEAAMRDMMPEAF